MSPFDLIYLDGEDVRERPLLERKARLRELVPLGSRSNLYAQHVHRTGHLLFAEACRLDLEGIVAKLASAPYRATKPSHWVKIKNSQYSQGEGRHELFEARSTRTRIR